ncbi:MAG TPA: hypothetical protein VF630_14225 [Hymenobacter sp.]|jgi:hypothetical protein
MHLNTTPLAEPAPLKKPCIRDMHELVTKHLPETLVKLTSFDELRRRCTEIDAEHPHLREETPVVLQNEARRRARHHRLQVAGSRTPAPLTASQAYVRA